MEALGINLGFLIFQILNFTIVMILLYAWAYKPIVNGLKKRQETIAQGLEDARIAAEARSNAEEEARVILTEAQSEASQKVREASERAEEHKQDKGAGNKGRGIPRFGCLGFIDYCDYSSGDSMLGRSASLSAHFRSAGNVDYDR